jgi:hypothetical protein
MRQTIRQCINDCIVVLTSAGHALVAKRTISKDDFEMRLRIWVSIRDASQAYRRDGKGWIEPSCGWTAAIAEVRSTSLKQYRHYFKQGDFGGAAQNRLAAFERVACATISNARDRLGGPGGSDAELDAYLSEIIHICDEAGKREAA